MSWRVVQELSNVAFEGFHVPFDHGMLQEYLDSVLLPPCVIFPDKEIHKEAVGVRWETRFSEDLQHGRVFRGLAITDPFR